MHRFYTSVKDYQRAKPRGKRINKNQGTIDVERERKRKKKLNEKSGEAEIETSWSLNKKKKILEEFKRNKNREKNNTEVVYIFNVQGQ